VRQEPAAGEPAALLASTGYLLARLGMESRRWWGQMLADHDLTPHQFGVLMALAQLQGASQRHISRVIGVDPRNAVPIIDSLQRQGLLERRPDPSDRRRHAVMLTADGQMMTEQLRRAGTDLEDRFLDSLSNEERARLHAILGKLFNALAGSQPPGHRRH
jgi:DNA-binding MarR family transcriptional regulator